MEQEYCLYNTWIYLLCQYCDKINMAKII